MDTNKDYHRNPLWKNAAYVGKEIHRLTESEINGNGVFQVLRERAESLPVSISLAHTSSDPLEFAKLVRTSYDQAHDTEYMLFVSLFYRYLEEAQVRYLLSLVQNVKWRLMMMVATNKMVDESHLPLSQEKQS
jgi:hypothetical protein